MKKIYRMKKIERVFSAILLASSMAISGCGMENVGTAVVNGETASSSRNEANQTENGQKGDSSGSAAVKYLDVSDMFSKRDFETDYTESECKLITLSGDRADCEDQSVKIEGSNVTITGNGSYILRGNLTNGSVVVDAAKEDKVQLILDGAEIHCENSAALYIKKADKVFVTLAAGSSNKLASTGEFAAIEDDNIDGTIFSKKDLTLNGAGSLEVQSEKGHGIVSKDDLVITGGFYKIHAANHGIEGKDSIRVADGDISVTCGKDAFHSDNEEDEEKGFVYIAGGNIQIDAGDDGIHGVSKAVISGGDIQIVKCEEGIEGAIVEIAGGKIVLTSKDDGLNAAKAGSSQGFGKGKSKESNDDVYILISGGYMEVIASGDGLDSNGNLYMTGGEVFVSGPENAGNGAIDYENMGEITGGKLVAAGSVGMAMNFSSAAQGSAIITLQSSHDSSDKISLKDSKGNILLEYTPSSRYSSVVVSCPEMKVGETYTLAAGEETREFTLEEYLYGDSFGFGGPGGGHGGFGERPEGGGRGDFGERPGDMGGFGDRPDDGRKPQKPIDSDI